MRAREFGSALHVRIRWIPRLSVEFSRRMNPQWYRRDAYNAESIKELLVLTLVGFAEWAHDFWPKLADADRRAWLHSPHRKRRYITRDPNKLYPGRPDLVLRHKFEVAEGFWMATNIGRVEARNILALAREVSGVKIEHRWR